MNVKELETYFFLFKPLTFQVEQVWDKRLYDISMIHYTGMPYAIFMKQIIYDMIETGQLHQLR